MFKTIIVGVDGLSGGEDAIALAQALARPGGEIVAVCVAAFDGPVSRAVNRDYEATLIEEAEAIAGRAAAAHPGMRSAGAVGATVGAGLHEAALRAGADLIVVGSCRRGPAGRVLAGDDARGSVRSAPCPVAVAPVGFAGRAAPPTRIGVGYDAGPEAGVALDVARAIAREAGTRPRAVEVVIVPNWTVPPSGAVYLTVDEEREAAQRRMDELGDVDGETRAGTPAKELAAFSQEIDLLVVGSRRQGPLGRIVMGSTSEALARHAHTPLLVVPRPAAVADPAAAAGGEHPARA
jgi:nucleotide-binding universal stress UspA family protein